MDTHESPTCLRAARQAAGLTVAKLSEATGIPSSSYSYLELGQRSIDSFSPERIEALLSVLHLTREQLLSLCPMRSSPRPRPTVRHANTYYIGNTLRAARTRAGLSRLTLAQSFSRPYVFASVIREWEYNNAPVPARHLPTLSAALGVSIDDLLAGVEIDEVLDVEREPTLNAPSRFQPTIVPAKESKKQA